MNTPAERLNNYIREKGIKQSFISDKSGINKSSLSAKLTGKTKITVEDIETICWAIDCTPAQFIVPRPPKTIEG